MHHDTEMIEVFMACLLGLLAGQSLTAYLQWLLVFDDWRELYGLMHLFLGVGPVFFLAIERRIHDKLGKCLRFFHAICAVTVLIYCLVFFAGVFVLFLGKRMISLF